MELGDVPSLYQITLARAVEALKARLGENLYSCILYGSIVRGNAVPKVSDINLLLVLNDSTPEAHAAIAEVTRGKVNINPFVIGRQGIARTFESFAAKFRSIHRNYRVLVGADPLAEMQVAPEVLRFICEQSLRNLRLRCVHGFIVFGENQSRYRQFLLRLITRLFIDLSELMRLAGTTVPHDFLERIPVLQKGLGTDTSVLHDLINFKQHPRRLAREEIRNFHARLFRLLDHAVEWMEDRWPNLMS
jgi:predicted nucleotidyltransferase